jgi:tetratricopeptide (TPR) repeat protein
MSGKSGKDPKPPKRKPAGLAKFCPNCGTQRTQGVAKFCENCGNSFDLSAAPNPEDDIAIRFPQESEALKQWAERYRPILTLGNAEEAWDKVWTLLEKLNVDSGHVWVSCEDDGECLLLPIDSAPPEEKSVNRVSMYVTELPAAADDKEVRKTDVNVACGACDGEGGEECLSCRGGSEWIQISEVIDVPTDLRLLLSHFPSREEELRSLCSEGDIDAMFHLARLFELANCIEEALHFYDLAATGGDVDAMFNAGILLRKGGDNVGAEKYWRSAGELGDFKAFSNLGSMFEGQGKNAEAIEMYESAIALGCAVSPGRLEKLREKLAAQVEIDDVSPKGAERDDDFFKNFVTVDTVDGWNSLKEALKSKWLDPESPSTTFNFIDEETIEFWQDYDESKVKEAFANFGIGRVWGEFWIDPPLEVSEGEDLRIKKATYIALLDKVPSFSNLERVYISEKASKKPFESLNPYFYILAVCPRCLYLAKIAEDDEFLDWDEDFAIPECPACDGWGEWEFET